MEIEAVINTIQAGYTANGEWKITTNTLLKLLGIDTVDFYRILYTLQYKLNYSEALQSFNQDSVGDLVTLLEALTSELNPGAGWDVEKALGAFYLPYRLRVTLTDKFIINVSQIFAVHAIDWEQVELMFRYKGNLWGTYQLYIESFFSFSTIIHSAIADFIREEPIVLERTAERYLESLFHCHLLSWEKLFYPLFLVLEKHFEQSVPEVDTEEDDPLMSAKKIFGITAVHFEIKFLKKRYKDLMKLYHPDLNPHGLEEAKKINNAYTILLAACVQKL